MTNLITSSTKECCRCHELKSTGDFYKKRDSRQAHCKECEKARKHRTRQSPEHKEYIREYNKKWRAENPEKIAEWNRNNSRKTMLKSVYGISLEDYDKLLRNQGDKCAICGILQKELNKPLYVDHDHKTSKIRGLLCHNCNVAIGLLKDSLSNISNALDYLKKHISD